MKDLRIPAVGYIRMSTDKQEDSPARQRGEIERMAIKGGYVILCWYEDHGLTGTESLNRPEFQRLLKDAAAGKFRAVLMYEQSRFSREDALDAMMHWRLFRDAGVKLVTCQRGEIRFDDLAGLITAIVGQHEARGESIRLAQRCLSGRTMRARQGIHTGRVPYGFDREIFDESGQLVRRVAWNAGFRKPLSWKSQIIPTADRPVTEAIQFVFHEAAQGRPLQQIAVVLNHRGLRTPKEKTFSTHSITKILRNPVYAGILRFGHKPVGKFAQCNEETILIPDAHPAIVDLTLFEQVQSVLDGAYKSHGKCEPGTYLLSKMVWCGHCGRRLVGALNRRDYRPDGIHRSYRCRTSIDGFVACEVYPSIDAQQLEGLVLRLVRERILSDANRGPLQAAARRLEARTKAPSLDAQQLAELRRKIERGTRNLALAEGDNFAAIAKLLDDWRDQERKLVARMRSGTDQEIALSPRVLDALGNLAKMRNRLETANRVQLAAALRESLVKVTIRRDMRYLGRTSLNRVFGTVTFHEELWPDGPIPFDDWDLNPEAHYVRVAKYISQAGRQVPLKELTNVIGLTSTTVRYHAQRVALAGLIEPVEPVSNGWQAVPNSAFRG
jgi:site-specific DNA recombinase